MFEIYASSILKPGDYVVHGTITWYRLTFSEFLASFSALALSVTSVASFVMSNYNKHTQNAAMLSSLYGESNSSERAHSVHEVKYGLAQAVDAFEVYVYSRKELLSSYCSYLCFGLMVNCFCFACCCSRSPKMQQSARRYRKFKLALERLALEQDIQYILQMNRITRLLHKDIFKTR